MTEDVLGELLADLDPEVASTLRLGGGPSSGLALVLDVDEKSGLVRLALVRPDVPLVDGEIRVNDEVHIEGDVLVELQARRRDTVDDSVVRAKATTAALDLGLPLAEVYSAGARWHTSPRYARIRGPLDDAGGNRGAKKRGGRR